MVKIQHINKTAINIQKTCIPPEKLCYWEKDGQAEQQLLLPELEKVSQSSFKAGKNHHSDWEKITSNRIILDTIKNVSQKFLIVNLKNAL